MRSYSRFFHSRVMAVVSGVDRSTLFRGRFIVHSRSEAHAHRPIEIRLACRSRVRADRAHARTHWTARFARVVARDRPRRTQPPPGCKCALNSAQQFCVRDERSHAPVAKGLTSCAVPSPRYIQNFSYDRIRARSLTFGEGII